jgi:hypothetical protein
MSAAATEEAGGAPVAAAAPATRTGYVWNERYMWHHAGKYVWR